MPQRYMHALMCFLSFLSLSAMGGLLGLTITQMVLPIAHEAINELHSLKVDEDACPLPDETFHHRNYSALVDVVSRNGTIHQELAQR